MGYTGDDIYQKVVAQKIGTEGLFQSKDQVFALVKQYQDLSEKIKNAAQKMEHYWKGDAAGAAQRGFGPAAVAYSTMGENLDKAQDLTRAQAQTFDEVHPKIKPIPSVPAEPSGMSNFMSYIPGLSEMTGSGDEVENYDNAMAAKQEAEANNIRHYSHLATSTDYNVGNLPAQYGPDQAEHGGISVGGGPGGSGHSGGESGGGSGGHTAAPMSAGGSSNGGGGAGSVGTGGAPSGSTAAPHIGGGGAPAGSGAAGGPQPSHAGGDAMPPGSSVPSTPAATANSNYAPPSPADGPNTGFGGGYASGGSTGGGSSAGYGGLGGGFVGGLGGSGGTSGASPRMGGGGRSGAGFEGGSGAKGAESGPKSGPRSGAGGAGRMAEEPAAGAARGAAGASGSGRAGGMPMGGGAGAGKKDDKEHETASYLVTQDNGNEIVGDLPATAPPVIGGDLEPPRPEQG